MSENKNNVQLIPTEKFFLPIDKLSNRIFDTTLQGFLTKNIIEKKKPQVITKVSLSRADLNQFDKLIFCAACSEYLAGNKIFTIRRIYQKIGGSHTLTEPMKKIISDSVNKLRDTNCTINMTAANEKFHYQDSKELVFKNYLLPCKSMAAKVNGQTLEEVFEFLDKPPLLDISELKRQFIQCDFRLLKIPKLRNTETVMKLKFFLLSRVSAIIGSHKPHKKNFVGRNNDGKPIYAKAKTLSKDISLETLFEQCDLSTATERQRRQARETVEKILEHFQNFGIIKNFEFLKKNGKFHSVKIDWD